MQVDLTREEIEVVLEGSNNYLESYHEALEEDCEDFAQCPRDHFWSDAEDIPMRQALIRKLEGVGK